MSKRRVVITGIGIVSPLANGREATWERLIAGKSGAGKIDNFDASDLPCKIAFQVPWASGRGGGGQRPCGGGQTSVGGHGTRHPRNRSL